MRSFRTTAPRGMVSAVECNGFPTGNGPENRGTLPPARPYDDRVALAALK